MPMSSIEKLLFTASYVTKDDKIDDCKCCGTYRILMAKKSYNWVKAAEIGITLMLHYSATRHGEERTLSPSTLFAWIEKYLGKSVQMRIQV